MDHAITEAKCKKPKLVFTNNDPNIKLTIKVQARRFRTIATFEGWLLSLLSFYV